MLDAETEALTGDLADELDRNDRARVDPRDIPTRYSLMKTLAASPAHYLEAAQRPQDDTIASRLGAFAADKKEALRFGTGVHLFLLGEPEKVAVYRERRDPRTKAWQEFQKAAAEEGRAVILNAKENAQAKLVADAIRRNAIAMRLLFDGTIIEKRIDWTFVGKAIRSTPDARSKKHVADLKTAQSAEPHAFVRQATRLFYHAQAWLYGEAIEANGEPRPADAYVIAVEKTAPRPVSILRFTDRALEQGARLCRTWIERLKVCEAANSWPEYLEDIGSFDVDGGELELEFNGRKVSL